MDFVSLHTHTTYSTGDGYGTVAQHISRVKELGMTAVALTEHGNVSSWVALEQECNAQGIKPIFGLEGYFAPPDEKRKFHMTLLTMNQVGLQNLNRIVTESWKTLGTTSKSKFPTINWPVLKEFNEGIIALSGCADSHLACLLLGGKSYGDKRMELRNGDFQNAIRTVQKYQQVFGDRYYLEVQRFPGLERTCVLNQTLAKISDVTGALLAATADVHYPFPTDNEMQKILHAAHRGSTVEITEANWEYDILLTYPTSDTQVELDLEKTFGNHPRADMLAISAVLETKTIAERCNVVLPKAPPVRYIP